MKQLTRRSKVILNKAGNDFKSPSRFAPKVKKMEFDGKRSQRKSQSRYIKSRRKYLKPPHGKSPRKIGKRPFDLGDTIVHAYSVTTPGDFTRKERTMSNNIWHKDHSAVQDTSSSMAAISNFMGKAKGEVFTIRLHLTVSSSILAIADTVVGLLKKKDIKSTIKSDEFEWIGIDAGSKMVAIVGLDTRSSYDEYAGPSADEKHGDLFHQRLGVFTVTAAGNREMLGYLRDSLTEIYKEQRYAQVKWWYRQEGRTTYQTTYLNKPTAVVRPEYYPNLKDPEAYIKRYLSSDAAVLLMAGAPGTGKTTLLRHMVYEHNLTASVVYDENLMESDGIFQQFLFNKEDDMLIIEDADVILTSRESDKNKLMSRFLNVSDGLIKLPNKKLIFTTNLSDFGRIDPALMRPGRCFDTLHTRALTYDEALRAATAAGLPTPVENREYTVAELFNQGRKQMEARRIGFTATK